MNFLLFLIAVLISCLSWILLVAPEIKNRAVRNIAAVVVGALIGLLFGPLALAAGSTATVSWQAPTQYNDNATPLPASDIASYTVTWTGSASGSKTIPGAFTSTTVNVPCGSVAFTVTVTTTSTATYPNATSDPAGPVPYASVACKPNPPTGLTAT